MDPRTLPVLDPLQEPPPANKASAPIRQSSLLEHKFPEVYFFCRESISAAKILRTAQLLWRRDLETMDDAERRVAIASLMARIGELQSSGALEGVPSDRLARVAKLIGEATEILAADPQSYMPLFRDREADPHTGKKPTALEWFDQVWKPRVEAGEATGDDIRQTDPNFYTNWASMLTKRSQKVSDFLPPSPTRGKIQETDDERRQRLSVAASKRVQRWRNKHKDTDIPRWQKDDCSAIEWFNVNWKPRIEREGLFSDDLKRVDPQLYSALAAAQTRAGASLGDLIPLRRRRLADMTATELEARKRAITQRSVERTRQRRKTRTPI